jgi:centromeric protein E
MSIKSSSGTYTSYSASEDGEMTNGSTFDLSNVPDEAHINVCVRVRPCLRNENQDNRAWEWNDNSINLKNSSTLYTYDHLFKPEDSNKHIFEAVIKNLLLQSIQGFHGSVFTYGQTSSGKTFTMAGNDQQPGIIPQAIAFSFDLINMFPEREFLFRISYLEVYNEQVKDLLTTGSSPKVGPGSSGKLGSNVKIQSTKSGTVLTGVKEQVVLNAEQVAALLRAGEAHRHVGSTDMNEKSSRAHTLFKLIIESKERGATSNTARVSTLSLVDLAGSENAKMTGKSGLVCLRACMHLRKYS